MTANGPRRWPPSAVFLLLANAAPLAGVLLHHWTVFAVVLLYWCENVIVGGFNVLRMLVAKPQESLAWLGKAFLIPFFCVHYGMFTFVDGVLVFAPFGGTRAHRGFGLSAPGGPTALREQGPGWGGVALILSPALSFLHNYWAGGKALWH